MHFQLDIQQTNKAYIEFSTFFHLENLVIFKLLHMISIETYYLEHFLGFFSPQGKYSIPKGFQTSTSPTTPYLFGPKAIGAFPALAYLSIKNQCFFCVHTHTMNFVPTTSPFTQFYFLYKYPPPNLWLKDLPFKLDFIDNLNQKTFIKTKR